MVSTGRKLTGRAAIAALALASIAWPATASAPVKDKKANDPERTICKSRSVIGSRLERVRECHTALEWEELKRSERLGLMRRQVNGDAGCSRDPPCTMIGGGKDTPW